MKIGVMVGHGLNNIDESLRKVAELGIHSCQLSNYDVSIYTPALAREIMEACRRYDVTISTFWAGWSGPAVWNFTEGPVTLGLLPAAYRHRRVQELKTSADFALSLGVRQVATHAGFIPENPHDPQYAGMIDAIRDVAQHMKDNGQSFLFETGQETPVTLLRAIEDVGTGNLGINLDTANLILYGKAHPLDALEILGRYVMDVHVKDGCWPTDGWRLGRETPLGEGLVNFPLVMKKLKALGYDGALTIEREISGEKKTEDILRAKAMLENLMD